MDKPETDPQLLESIRQADWHRRPWEPTYTLVERATGARTFHLGDDFDSDRYSVANKEVSSHCLVCWANLMAGSTGYYNGDDWLCEACHHKHGLPAST